MNEYCKCTNEEEYLTFLRYSKVYHNPKEWIGKYETRKNKDGSIYMNIHQDTYTSNIQDGKVYSFVDYFNKFKNQENTDFEIPFKIGDYVKITKSKYNWNKKMDNFDEKIVKITNIKVFSDYFEIKFEGSGSFTWRFTQGHFVKAYKPEDKDCKSVHCKTKQELDYVLQISNPEHLDLNIWDVYKENTGIVFENLSEENYIGCFGNINEKKSLHVSFEEYAKLKGIKYIAVKINSFEKYSNLLKVFNPANIASFSWDAFKENFAIIIDSLSSEYKENIGKLTCLSNDMVYCDYNKFINDRTPPIEELKVSINSDKITVRKRPKTRICNGF